MFVEDYRELKIENAEKIANRCFLFEKFVDDLLAQEPEALRFKHDSRSREDRIHPHCHAKSILNPAFMRSWPNVCRKKSDSARYSMLRNGRRIRRARRKIRSSLQVAQDLIDKLENQGRETKIIASGTSCRHQITDLTNVRPKHMAELLAEALV